jgi:hypothetical protein
LGLSGEPTAAGHRAGRGRWAGLEGAACRGGGGQEEGGAGRKKVGVTRCDRGSIQRGGGHAIGRWRDRSCGRVSK